jgi:dolichol-phosphate mannosyltransferase
MSYNYFKQAIKYMVVGSFGTLLNLLVMYFSVELLGLWYLFGGALGFFVGVTVNYFLNKEWTFYDKKNVSLLQYKRYLLISLIGLAGGALLLLFLVEVLGLWYLFSQILAILIMGSLSFILHKFWTFSN